MKKCFIFLLLFCSQAFGAYTLKTLEGWDVQVASNSCSDVLAGLNSLGYWPGQTAVSCSGNPVIVGTGVTWSPSATVFPVSALIPVCLMGTHLDTSTNTCVDDVTIAVASCMPSIRTISPCPSGYAPTNAIPAGSGAPSPFTSDMDGLPIQDMIYAVGIAICGLLGIGTGVKLV